MIQILTASLVAITLLTAQTPAGTDRRDAVLALVAKIRSADYADDRAGLKTTYEELSPFIDDKDLGSRAHYWRGFAMWRRVLNGFNDSVPAKEQAADLELAVKEFDDALTQDPNFVDAKIAENSCLGSLIFLHRNDAAKVKELATRAVPLLQQASVAEPDNPRLLWVSGSILWYQGNQDKAIETYQRGLKSVQKQDHPQPDSLDPNWGEPELLMNLAWSNLNRTKPDLDAADRYANDALTLVPSWHYVKDILLPQIREAKDKH